MEMKEKQKFNSLYGKCITLEKKLRKQEIIKDKLLKLGFNINSVGFDYWIRAIEVYQPNVKMESVYFTLAQFFGKKPSLIERGMRTASETSKEKIKEYYKYDGKLSNKTILNLITKFKEE